MPEFRPFLGDNLLTFTRIVNGKVTDSIDIWRHIVPNNQLYKPEWKQNPKICVDGEECQPLWGLDSEIRPITYCIHCQTWEMGHNYSKEN